jgi:hypothetical protein
MLCQSDRLDNEALPDAIIGGLFVATLAKFVVPARPLCRLGPHRGAGTGPVG